MSLHRAFGLLAALSMLQANLRVAYAACEAVDSRPQAAEMVDANDAEHHAHHSQRESPEDTSVPDKGPPVACCQAMTSCGSVIDLGRVTEVATDELTETVAIPAIVRIPLSRIAAPEPPPPKA